VQNYAHYCCGSHYQRIYKTKANKRLGRCFSRFSSREHSELCTFLELKNLFGSHATVHRATFFRLIRRRYAKMNRSKDYILGLAPLLHAFSFASKDRGGTLVCLACFSVTIGRFRLLSKFATQCGCV